MDVELGDKIPHWLLPDAEQLDDLSTGGIREGFKMIHMHDSIYT
jgi:hypothetical protein